jgi:hypothetical protein
MEVSQIFLVYIGFDGFRSVAYTYIYIFLEIPAFG